MKQGAPNIVELVAEPDDCAFDQPCRFGNRVEGHAVYCHNDAWTGSPRKCRRTWYTGGETKDEDCPGFEPNLDFNGVLNPSPLLGEPCSACKGTRAVRTERETLETCGRCCGDGREPKATKLTEFEQDTLELGCSAAAYRAGGGAAYVRMAETEAERSSLSKLWESDLIDVRSVSYAGTVCAYLCYLTGKGDAVMRANWAAKKAC